MTKSRYTVQSGLGAALILTGMHATLVDTQTLAKHLKDPDWAIFDCRSVLGQPDAGPAMHAEGHIPGARYLHLERDLSGPVTPVSGRHPLPDPQALAAALGRHGVGQGTQVVAYDAGDGSFAARLWWLLRWLGHKPVAVLDGGWRQWTKEGREISKAPQPVTAKAFDYRAPPRNAWLDTGEIQRLSDGRSRGLLIDARAPARFRGEQETVDPVAGHVPGAVNLPFAGNVSEDGRFLPPAELRQRYVRVMGGYRPDEVVCMCGSGVTACHNLLAMEIAGLGGARLYSGSWSEWIRDPERPVARGDR